MDTKKFSLPDMVLNRYTKDRNTVIKWKNKTKETNLDLIDSVALCDLIANLSDDDKIILKSELNKCWTAFFEAVEDYVFPVLDDLQNLKLD